MHIPDGYLGPQTYVPAFTLMAGLWTAGTRRLQKTLRARQAPQLALAAAFTFVVMMFNVPIPGGTTGHAVGGVLVAILLGPWAAMIAVSLALVIQAFIFSDGGISALGANCINMAVVMPFTGWWVYRAISGSAPARSARHSIGGFLGGYLGLAAAALSAGIMFGIQPLICHDAAGRPLYCPFGLKTSITAMAVGHLGFFGVIEALITGLAIGYIQKTFPEMIRSASGEGSARGRRPRLARLGIGLAVLALVSPLGLYLPARFGAGSAWGEWSTATIGKMAGFVPKGMAAEEGKWHGVLPAYGLPGQESAPLLSLCLSYILSAFVGIVLVMVAALLLRRLIGEKDGNVADPELDDTPNRVD